MRPESELPGEHSTALVTPEHGFVGRTVAVFGVGYEGEGVAETPAALSARVHSAVCNSCWLMVLLT